MCSILPVLVFFSLFFFVFFFFPYLLWLDDVARPHQLLAQYSLVVCVQKQGREFRTQ
eukprot:m.288965 g.288965  ORF g.288965 m.288965 type:complete len:57 (-) comp12054_c0_seq1:1038-1208(-)